MKKNALILTYVLIALLSSIVISCNNNRAQLVRQDKLKKTTSTDRNNRVTVHNFIYEGGLPPERSARLVRITDDASNLVSSYDYSIPNKVTETIVMPAPSPAFVTTYTIDDKGVRISDDRGGSYTHDADLFIKTLTQFGNTTTRTIADECVSTEIRTGANPANFSYDYSSKIDNHLDDGLFFSEGRGNRYWPDHMINGGQTIAYTYVGNPGKITKRTTTIGGQVTETVDYEYY